MRIEHEAFDRLIRDEHLRCGFVVESPNLGGDADFVALSVLVFKSQDHRHDEPTDILEVDDIKELLLCEQLLLLFGQLLEGVFVGFDFLRRDVQRIIVVVEVFKLVSYCDDLKPAVSSIEEFLLVDLATKLFEKSLNRGYIVGRISIRFS